MKKLTVFCFAAAVAACLVAAPATAQVSYVDAVTADSPIGWWRMTDATDSAGDHDGTAGTTTVFGVPGPIVAETNGAAQFDGTADSSIFIPDAPEMNFGRTGDFSVEAWVYRSIDGSTMTICNKGDDSGSFWLRWYADGRFRLLLDWGTGSGKAAAIYSTGAYGVDQWYHVVATADRDDSMKMYVNGALDGEAPLAPVIVNGDLTSEGDIMTIGSMDSRYYFNGGLDDFALYGTALDASQVTAHYQAAGSGGYAAAVGADSPIAYFPFGADGSDATGNHYGFADSGITFDEASPIVGDTDGAALFDGTEYANVLVDDAADLNFGVDTDFTIETWFKREPGLGVKTAIVQKGISVGEGKGLWARLTETGAVQFYLDFGTTGLGILSDEGYDDGEWHYLVASADRDDSLQMFIDGDLVREEPFWVNDISSPGQDLQIGQLNGGTPFAGSMDELALYDTALTLEQVQAHYSAAFEGGSTGIEGDLDGDGYVGSSDLDLVRGNWGASVSGKENGDATGDGVVDSADLDVVRANWGQGTPAAVPEPNALLLLAGAFLLGTGLRRKA